MTWTEQRFEGDVHALGVDRGQFVAVGRVGQQLTAWTSADAGIWEASRVPDPSFVADAADVFGENVFEQAAMGPLVRLGDTLYSIGTFWGDNDGVRPVGWRLSDGGAWEYIESQSPFFAGCCNVFDVVAADDALLAVKHNFAVYSGETWRWTSESSWQDTTPMKQPDTGTSGADILDAVWAEGAFVAVGVAADGNLDAASEEWATSAASWTSPDGVTWQAAPSTPELEGAVMYSISQSPGGGFVAVGCAQCKVGQDGVPAAWTSRDALSWSPAAMPGEMGSAYRVVALEHGLLAIGARGDETLTWTSIDGVTWEPGETLLGSSQRHLSFGMNLAVRDDDVVLILDRGDQTVVFTGFGQQ